MKLKFWKKSEDTTKRETILKVIKSNSSNYIEHYVCAQSPEEAKQLLKDIQTDSS